MGAENSGNIVNASNFPSPIYQLTPWHHNLRVANHVKFEEMLEKK
jgi:hypothetical protein